METQIIPDLANLSVSELWILGWKEWDIELVEEIFSESDACEIASIPLSSRCQEYTLIWHHDRRGRYTVKSAYHIARRISMHAPIERREEGSSKVWDLHAPSRLKLLLWRACTECLPTRLNLCKRGMPLTATCVLCEASMESTLHLFTECEFAARCWIHASQTAN